VSKLDRIRVAVIGTGSISTDDHIPGWQAIPDAEIVALADASELALASAKKLVPDGVRLVNDYRELLDDSDIDVFDICAPSALHAEISIAAMQAGKHVLCEKPMATCREDAARVLTARNETGRHYMTALHMRVDPSVVSLRKALESVPLGEVYYARAQWLRRRRLPGRKGFTTRALSGGGPSYDLGVHMFDLAWWMMGCPRPVRVSGTMSDRLVHRTDLASEWGEWDPATIDVEDFAAGWIRFENSAVLALETSWLMFDNVAERWQVQLYGDQAGAVWPECRIFGERDSRPWDIQVPRIDEPRHIQRTLIQHFAALLRGEAPAVIPAEQSATSIAVLDGLYRSAASGCEVEVEPFV